jgi:hypothetical protein
MPRGCELGVDLVQAENTYATKKVILEVELEVGVLLDGLEDLNIWLALLRNNHTAWYIP